jgi:hypothetical protein
MQQEQLLLGEWLDSLMFEVWGGKALTLKVKGSVYQVATNGHALLLVAGAGNTAAPSDKVRMVTTLLGHEKPSGRFTVDLATLRAWLPTDAADPPCPKCDGGKLKEFRCTGCGGSGVQECRECGSERECRTCGGAKKSNECLECEGDGTVAAPISPAPVVGDVVLDRRVLQRFLGPLLAGPRVEVSYGEPLDPVFMRGAGWTLVAMPFKHDVEQFGELGPALPREAP